MATMSFEGVAITSCEKGRLWQTGRNSRGRVETQSITLSPCARSRELLPRCPWRLLLRITLAPGHDGRFSSGEYGLLTSQNGS